LRWGGAAQYCDPNFSAASSGNLMPSAKSHGLNSHGGLTDRQPFLGLTKEVFFYENG
jgi:hypothetical protein